MSKPKATKYVLITGCSLGGIGSALAESFSKRGLHVLATARSVAKMSHLSLIPNITLLTLDVTSTSSIDAAVKSVAEHTGGGGRLDYLVNNAGVNYITPFLDTDLTKAREVFDTNFWGTLAMIQAFAPLIISAKGTIVNTSSILSILNTPYSSIYNASKAAISIFDEVLRLELAPLGVRVLTTVTGSVKTEINEQGSGFVGLGEGSRYKGIEKEIEGMAHGKGIPNQMRPEEYAEMVVGDVLGGKGGKIWRGGNVGGTRLAGVLPQGVMDMVVLKGTGLDVLEKGKKGK